MDEKQNNPKDGLFSVAYIFVSEMSFVIQSSSTFSGIPPNLSKLK
jgi:hypothetical protein